jgi:hypothetical protein
MVVMEQSVPARERERGGKGLVLVKLFFDDQDFDGQLLRAISYTAYGGADISGCLLISAQTPKPRILAA